jgi:hypothetical protein
MVLWVLTGVLWVVTAEANRRYQSINPLWDSVLSNPIRTNVSLRCGTLNRGYTKLCHEPSHSLTPYSHAFAGGDSTDANKQTVMISGVPVCPSIRKAVKAITVRLSLCDAPMVSLRLRSDYRTHQCDGAAAGVSGAARMLSGALRRRDEETDQRVRPHGPFHLSAACRCAPIYSTGESALLARVN